MSERLISKVVRFRTGDGEYAVAVEHAREVRTAAGMVQLPAPGAGVVGLLPRDGDSLTVIDALGSGRDRVLVLDNGDRVFGLLVEEVSGVVTVDPERLGPPPQGQTGDLVSAVLHGPDGLVLLVDTAALARRLTS